MQIVRKTGLSRVNANGTYVQSGGVGSVPGSPGTRRAQFAFSCGGMSNIGPALADAHERTLITVPVNTTRWRIRLINKNAAGTAVSGATTITGVYKGLPAVTANTAFWTGAFTATPAQALTSFILDATGATDTVSAWVTDPTLQFVAGQGSMLAIGWTSAATTYASGAVAMYFSSGAGKNTDAGVAAPSLTFATSPRLTWRVEYEFAGSTSIGIVWGDSLTEGYDPDNTTTANLTMNKTWHQLVSQRMGIPICVSGWYGSATSSWTAVANNIYQQWVNSGLTIDFVIIDLGSNDASGGAGLATYQANLALIVGIAKTLGIPNVYLCTIAPRGLTGTPETNRLAYNAWLRTHPLDVQGVFDFDLALAASLGGSALASGYGCSDGVHWTPVGHHVAANAVSGRIGFPN